MPNPTKVLNRDQTTIITKVHASSKENRKKVIDIQILQNPDRAQQLEAAKLAVDAETVDDFFGMVIDSMFRQMMEGVGNSEEVQLSRLEAEIRKKAREGDLVP